MNPNEEDIEYTMRIKDEQKLLEKLEMDAVDPKLDEEEKEEEYLGDYKLDDYEEEE